ncbi:MAG: metalloprotease, partial [Flavobacteriaceae bacterium]
TEVLQEKWVIPHPDSLLVLDKGKSNQVAINPFIGLPESRKENNWKSTQSKLFKKPVSLKFVKDIEVPNRNQLFVNPINNYNAYDGISLGLRLHNKKLTRQDFKIDIRPQYSFLEENIVGSYSLSARFNSLERKNYLTTIALGGSSFHYASGLRYNVIAPQLAFFFRTPDFRSNKQQVLSASWYNISKEIAVGVDTSPEYGVFKLEHLYSDKATINHLTFGSSYELANSFSKIRFNLDYRKLFASGRQFQVRFFAGKFLTNKKENDGFFDFSLTRPNDYLYQYQYLGRSDTTGFFSQQFILAEGGLKSNIVNPNVGDYLVSTNLMLSLWKWVEAYGDITLAKNHGQPIKSYWGTGIRLNLVPDYLEVYFPVYSNFGFELNNNAYARDLRLVLTIQPKQLMTLFTRKWF